MQTLVSRKPVETCDRNLLVTAVRRLVMDDVHRAGGFSVCSVLRDRYGHVPEPPEPEGWCHTGRKPHANIF